MNAADHVLCHGFVQRCEVRGDRNALLANVSQYENGQGGSNSNEWYGTAGFYCWPDPPDDDGTCCEVKTIKEGEADPIIASRDLRLSARAVPNQGQVGATHYGGGYLTLRWDDGRTGSIVALSSTRLADGPGSAVDKAHILLMDPTEANTSIQLLHELGTGLVMNKDGDVYLSNGEGKGRLTIYADGAVHLKCDEGLKVSGATIVGDVTTAREVALVAQVIALAQAVLAMAATISTQLQAVPATGAGLAGDIAALTAALTQIQGIGTAKTLKASPV